MERREFIRKMLLGTGIGGGALLTCTAALLGYYQPRKEFYLKADAGEREKLALPKKVVVVGGGLAGISSALELATRGFEVTLLESSSALGGKLTGWDIDALGERFPVEHGFHGFFDQYYNLNEIFAAAGVPAEAFDLSPGYPVIFRNSPKEVFGRTSRLFPLNVLSVLEQSKRLDLRSFLNNSKGWFSTSELFRYEYAHTFHQFDAIDFLTYCRKGETLPAFVDTVLHPFADATMNRMEVLSAAEALRYFHFYFMGSPEGLSFRITRRDCMTALINPLEARLKSLGVTLRKGCSAIRLETAGGKVSGVLVDGGGSGGSILLDINPGDLPKKGFASFSTAGGIPVMLSRKGSWYVAYDGRCTHMGCPVTPDESGGGFSCPCHAGRFDASGRPVGGPPKAPLAPLSVELRGSRLVVSSFGSSGNGELLECDYCVVASNVRGVRELVKSSSIGHPEFESAVSSLGEADPYAVYRLWLDRPFDSGGFPFYTVSGYAYTDSITHYSDFQEPFKGWAKKNGGSVVELHAYAIAPEDLRGESELKRAMLEELHAVFPETRGATVLHELFMMQSNFTRWAPGDHARRPGVETPLPNLFLAGDWVKVDAPVFLMEAAAFTGRMAANAIFRRESLRQIPLPIVPMHGLFA